MNPFALTAEERAGAMMEPATKPDVGAFMDNIGALRAMVGPSAASRMIANTEAQKDWLAAGNRGPRLLTEQNIWLADDVAGAMVGPIGFAGIFAGVGAKTADHAALKMAKEMAEQGADPRSIWRDTGWFEGPDKKWRWEIDDSGATIDPSGMFALRDGELRSRGRAVVSDVVTHDQLYQAYPEVAGVRTRMDIGKAQDNKGSFSDYGAGRLKVQASDSDMARSLALHELQHGVQTKEGFARGASVAEYARGPMFDQKAIALKDDLSELLYGGITGRPEDIARDLRYARPEEVQAITAKHGFANVDEAIAFLKTQDEKRTPFSQYRRTAGEAEARAVQVRRDMTSEQRRKTFPLDSYDVPVRDLIIRDVADAINAALDAGKRRERSK